MGACASSLSRVAPSQGNGRRLIVYSEYAAELPNFEQALKSCGTTLQPYKFESTTCEDFCAMLTKLVHAHGLFERIALAPHGPNHAPPPQGASGDECRWELSKMVVLSDPCELSREDSEVRKVLCALGRSTICGGRVDLLSCSVLSTWACPRSSWPKLRGFAAIEEEADCRFAASTHALDGDPLQSEEEWLMETDASQNIKLHYFLPQNHFEEASELPGLRDVQLQYAKANASLIKVAPVFEH